MLRKTSDVRCQQLVSALHRIRGDFSALAQTGKARLLRELSGRRTSRAEDVLRLHDELLFLAAFPDNPTIAALAEKGLRAFQRRVRLLSPRQYTALGDSGVAGSVSDHTFMYGVVRWLVAHDELVTPVWGHSYGEELDPLIRLTLLPAEADAFESGDFTARQWIEHASARIKGGALHWLVGPKGGAPGARELYDHAELPVKWSLGDSPRSITRNRGPVSQAIFRTAFRRPPSDPIRWIARPLPRIRRVMGAEAVQWIDASIAALVARCREVGPTIYANPDEVYVADLGEGARLCVIGAHPDDRLALEANFGYVMFSNGIPVGYGGVTPLADQANTGANLFEAFRRSEAAFLFGQTLRAFRSLFGISRFVVNPYQFGAGNDEALQSGAFWFYDRLGFRPTDPETGALVERERARLATHSRLRSSVATLRRLAQSDLVLELNAESAVPMFAEHNLARVGRLVAADFAAIPSTNRDADLRDLVRSHARLLGGVDRPLNSTELRGARLLCPVFALVERELRSWPPDQRQGLWNMVRAKGGKHERRFALLSRQHAQFWRALAGLFAGEGAGRSR